MNDNADGVTDGVMTDGTKVYNTAGEVISKSFNRVGKCSTTDNNL